MKKLTSLLFALLTIFTFNACEDTSDPAGPGALLVRTTWRVDGIYANNAKVPGTEFNISMRFTGTPAIVNINGVPATIWALNNAGTQMTLTYPSSTTELQFSSNTVDFTVSQNSLIFKAPATGDLSFFGGLITVSAGSELRLIPADSAPTQNTTNSTLTTGTWTSTGEGAGLYNRTSGNLVSSPNVTFKFRTILGINTLTISGIPSPAVWSYNGNVLSISYPTGTNNYETVSFEVSTLNTNSLILRRNDSLSVFGVQFAADNELRLIQLN